MRRDVPLRRSLLLKLLVLSALVSACSIAATAWLTVHVTAVAIRQEQGQALTDDARIYDALLGYAATHHDWSGAAATVTGLARQSGHRITLTDADRHPLLDSASGLPGATGNAGDTTLPAEASATVDPLAGDTARVTQTQPQAVRTASPPSQAAASAPCAPDSRCLLGLSPAQDHPTLYPTTPSDIDTRAVGPFRVTAQEQARLRRAALKTAACLRTRLRQDVQVLDLPSGRPYLRFPQNGALYLPTDCNAEALDYQTPSQTRALTQLGGLVDTCLDHHGMPPVRLNIDFSWTQRTKPTSKGDDHVTSCIDTARREQLAPYVAPAALLFVSSPPQTASTFLDLSPANRARIAEVTGLVLVVTLTVTALAGTRMVRPLRALAGAARRMTQGDLTARVKVSANDEIGGVAAAFNTMSERREQSEGLRKAMASDVAHELRTPLSNIRGWLEAAEDGLVVPDRALLSSLLEEAVLLQHVIDDLRDLSAADAGELRLHTEAVDLADVLGQVATAHRGTADATDVTLVTEVRGRPVLTADPVRLRQAVGNLVSNAVRHTPPGGTVTLRARIERGTAVIDVADTGAGISAEDLPRVFDRFWRAEKSRSRQTGGSGLGLSIVRKLAEAHGGTVSAASTPGAGSVFTVTIPG
jgi:two-component system sensor histidine kinase BaeS